MRRSVDFYRDAIGLPLRFESPTWTEFATGGATLALHAADGAAAALPHNAAGTCRPGLTVPDLAAFHESMLARGVTCLRPPKEEFGVKLAEYADPDGLAISVSEAR